MRDDQGDNVVCLTTAANPALAHIWQQALEDEGIDCKVVGDYLDAGLGDMPGMRAELWVHRNDVDRAQAILESHPAAAHEEKDDEEA
jgi:hypothetical protein